LSALATSREIEQVRPPAAFASPQTKKFAATVPGVIQPVDLARLGATQPGVELRNDKKKAGIHCNKSCDSFSTARTEKKSVKKREGIKA
jgi:hypothetical protein